MWVHPTQEALPSNSGSPCGTGNMSFPCRQEIVANSGSLTTICIIHKFPNVFVCSTLYILTTDF